MHWTSTRSATAALLVVTALACQPAGRGADSREGAHSGLPPLAALEAQRWLAGRLELSTDEVAIASHEQRQWADSCLGLGGPAESCLAVITPGWRVALEAGGQRFEVRTDESGRTFRSPQVEPAAPGPPAEPPQKP